MTSTRNLEIRTQRGFGAIAAIVILVILASLAAGLATLGTTQQLTSAQDLLSARALVAARTGLDVGLFKAINSTTSSDPWKTCSNLSQSLDLSAQTGFHVNVTCNSWLFDEGNCDSTDPDPHCVTVGAQKVKQVRLYRIEATACSSATSCPDATLVGSPGYIERVRQVIATN